jgi:hypothetical protein
VAGLEEASVFFVLCLLLRLVGGASADTGFGGVPRPVSSVVEAADDAGQLKPLSEKRFSIPALRRAVGS